MSLYNIPMKCEHHRDFLGEIDWKHFHRWFKKAKGDNNDKKVKTEKAH